MAETRGYVLVTGAATGLGLALARALTRAGYSVLAAVMPGQDAQPLRDAGAAAVIEADLSREADVSALVQSVSAHGALWAIISNAGVSVPGPLELVPMELIRRQYQVNVLAPLQLVQGLLPDLRKTRGRVIIIGAGQARVPLPYGGPYGSSKAALAAFADSLRAEVDRDGIRVSVIEPGAIKTGILQSSIDAWNAIASGVPESVAPGILERYRRAMDRTFAASRRAFASAPSADEFARIVLRILASDNPGPRYLIGREARALGLIALLPARLRARIVARLA